MGLDQYLYAKKSIWPFMEVKVGNLPLSDFIESEFPGLPVEHELQAHVHVDVNVIYWRKSNQIHRWFVNNVQDGNDDCGSYYVPTEKLYELRDLCKEVLDTRNHELLEPQGGFFFGSTEIDEWYWEDIRETYDKLDKLLHAHDRNSGVHFVYTSSW